MFMFGLAASFAAASLPFSTIASAGNPTVGRSAGVEIAATRQQRLALDARFFGIYGAIRQVQLRDYVVVAVFSGIRPTGGYDLRVTRVTANSRQVCFTVHEGPPGATTALTSPFTIIRVRRAGPLKHDIPRSWVAQWDDRPTLLAASPLGRPEEC
jgi:PrcB C-terminal